jgi:hypothetical protein
MTTDIACPSWLFWIRRWPTARPENPVRPPYYSCTGIRLPPTSGATSSRLSHRLPIASRQTSSVSDRRESPTLNIASSTTFAISTPFSTKPGSHRLALWRRTGGTALAFHLAVRRPESIRGLAFMEFIGPMPTWDDFPASALETFKKFRTPGIGEKMILEGNAFVEGALPTATVRKLTDEEMSVYRAPFATPESSRPTWRFPNDLPIAGEPADVYSARQAHRALAQSTYPKLLFVADPGALVSADFR